jgi:hypothetical protein
MTNRPAWGPGGALMEAYPALIVTLVLRDTNNQDAGTNFMVYSVLNRATSELDIHTLEQGTVPRLCLCEKVLNRRQSKPRLLDLYLSFSQGFAGVAGSLLGRALPVRLKSKNCQRLVRRRPDGDGLMKRSWVH